jgi:TolB protein
MRRSMKTRIMLTIVATAAAVIAVLLPAALPAQDYNFITIQGGKYSPPRVAVPAMTAGAAGAATASTAAVNLTQLMREGVGMSGILELIPPDAYPAAGADADNGATWKLINTDYIIHGSVESVDGRRYQVEFRCYSVRDDSMILGKRYTGEKELFGRMVFRFLDELIEKITGQRGCLEGRIAYVSDATGRNEIRVMDLDGGNDQAITSNRTLNLSPSWSPDGSKIVYTDYRDYNPNLYIADVGKNINYRVFGDKGLNASPEFSPDGGSIVFSHEDPDGNINIYLMSPDGKNPRRVTSSSGSDVSPTFAPDGKRIAFVSDRTGSPQIYVLNIAAGPESAGNPASLLTTSGEYNTSPEWSPDGNYIAFNQRAGGQFDLFLIDMTTHAIKQLTATGANEEDPSWSPDSRFIVFDSNRGGNYDIYIMSIYGGTPKRITTKGAKERMPAWQPVTGE